MNLPSMLPFLFVSALGCGTLHAAENTAASFVLDPDHSFVQFEVLHFGTSTLRGRFGPISGVVGFDRSAQRGEISLRIDTRTLNTGVPVLDARLRQPDLLATDAFPEAYFVASRFRFEGTRLAEVRGEFTLRGVSQPLSLHALRFSCRIDSAPPAAPGASGAPGAPGAPSLPHEVCGGDFEARLLRSDFGASFGLPFVGDSVRLLVQVEGRRR